MVAGSERLGRGQHPFGQPREFSGTQARCVQTYQGNCPGKADLGMTPEMWKQKNNYPPSVNRKEINTRMSNCPLIAS